MATVKVVKRFLKVETERHVIGGCILADGVHTPCMAVGTLWHLIGSLFWLVGRTAEPYALYIYNVSAV